MAMPQMPIFDSEDAAIQEMKDRIKTMELDLEIHDAKIALEGARLDLRIDVEGDKSGWDPKRAKRVAIKDDGVVKAEVIKTEDVPLPPMYDFSKAKTKNHPAAAAAKQAATHANAAAQSHANAQNEPHPAAAQHAQDAAKSAAAAKKCAEDAKGHAEAHAKTAGKPPTS